MPTNIPGNPANYPANIRAPSGSDARNATTEDAAFQDLADRTAFLHSNRTSQYQEGSTAAMQALVGVGSGEVCYVSGLGFFSYWSSSSYGLNEPFIYPSAGMGHGAWVNDLWQLLLTSPTDTTIRAALIAQPLLAYGNAAPASNITFSTTSGTLSNIVTTTVDVTGFSGKTLRVAISGLVASVSGSFSSTVDVLLRFNDSGTTTHTGGQLTIPTGAFTTLSLNYDFEIPTGATSCTVAVRGSTGGGTLAVTGLTSTQWLQWSIITIPG